MNTAVNNPCWKGLLASFILPGAGQFFQGRFKVAVFVFLLGYGFAPMLLLLLFMPLVPPIIVLLLVPIGWMAGLYFLVDAWRPTPRIGWGGWLLAIVISITVYFSEKAAVLSVCRIYSIPTDSMSPTVQKGDIILCLRAAYWFGSPQHGDIVVFPYQNTTGYNAIFEKRLVGLPGDILTFKRGALLVNDIAYRYPGQALNYSPKITGASNASLLSDQVVSVPTGMVYVLGDNPPRSADSRYFGAIPLSSLIGKISVILWPVHRVQRISN